MTQDHITLYLTRERAFTAGSKVFANMDNVEDFDIIPGIAKWEDGTRDQGFKVRITLTGGANRWL